MNVEVLVPCLHYSDFLSLTLPVTRRLFNSVTVITAPDDLQTIQLCAACDVFAFQTDAWSTHGASFNKAAALNEYLSTLKAAHQDCWILLLDADILFVESITRHLAHLDQGGLYSIRRRLCETEADLGDFLDGALPFESFHVNVPPIVNGRVWGRRPTSNPAGLLGYLQLWHLTGARGLRTLPESQTAAKYDVQFGLSFPEHLRKYLDCREVLHLGTPKVNWRGRVSSRWNGAALSTKIARLCQELQ